MGFLFKTHCNSFINEKQNEETEKRISDRIFIFERCGWEPGPERYLCIRSDKRCFFFLALRIKGMMLFRSFRAYR